MTVTSVRDVHIPSATPLVYSFEARESLSGCAASIKPMGDPTQLGMTGRYIATKEIVRLALESPISPVVPETAKPSKATSSSSSRASIPSNTKIISSTHLEDTLSSHHDDSSSFYDLIDKGLTDIIEYANNGRGQKDALIITDGRGYIVHSNQAWEDLCGFHIDEIQGKTNEFLQGPLSNPSIISALNQDVQSGLPVQTQLINYRKSGAAFENKITIIPVYSWLSEVEESESNHNNHHTHNSCDNYDDPEKKVLSQKEEFLKKPLPSHFVAKLDVTPDDPALPPLTEEQMAKRGLNPRKPDDDVNA
jgi:PAS domain S-box-containing protein